MNRALLVAASVFALAACGRGNKDSSPFDAGADPGCSGPTGESHRDLRYAGVAGVDPGLLSLDVHVPPREADCAPAPVVVWVHGGGWAVGDKGNKIEDKARLFNGVGWLFVSVNYRLSPNPDEPDDPDRVRYPIHPQDVAAAIAWVHAHAAEYGGDPQKLVLLGHSAGAHLVALVSTDEQFLGAHGLGLANLRCTASLDTEGYDIPLQMQTATSDSRAVYVNAFGDDPAVWRQASPIEHVEAGKSIPDFLFAARGKEDRRAVLAAFDEALRAAGVATRVIEAGGLSHEEINTSIGERGDEVITPPLMEFFLGCLAD